ncbi:dihydroxyacetone kinase phosphoryl donor subunit DhaM [Kitasatospora sp. NBC_01250]|uniref:dihydroxyacetone kinase phosphoryl donor subunit DhaM n=1 Tax=unclassified Kitasatospora TaxID=2633591 RepID=UPI002E1195C4|nr:MULTISPECIES: dihydroxyacetone kinase phosphoryl donor subunit DhaM [unclassified Kitasatospora]WSJ67249.1 dihydroxyacetone kinase phosphoryl donor subunit DhaM [Kitasatospora sp. NBC_01302]
MRSSVGIVLVSHSPLLGAGVRELVEQLGGGSVAVEVAAGTEDGGIGTSYELIAESVRKVDGGAGVVLLPDLGSSVLTARAVLADLERAELVLVDAPFVEGAVAAVVTASTGAALAEVVRSAQEAWQAHKF